MQNLEKRKYACNLCKAEFNSISKLREHVKAHTVLSSVDVPDAKRDNCHETSFVCRFCKETIPFGQYYSHLNVCVNSCKPKFALSHQKQARAKMLKVVATNNRKVSNKTGQYIPIARGGRPAAKEREVLQSSLTVERKRKFEKAFCPRSLYFGKRMRLHPPDCVFYSLSKLHPPDSVFYSPSKLKFLVGHGDTSGELQEQDLPPKEVAFNDMWQSELKKKKDKDGFCQQENQ